MDRDVAAAMFDKVRKSLQWSDLEIDYLKFAKSNLEHGKMDDSFELLDDIIGMLEQKKRKIEALKKRLSEDI